MTTVAELPRPMREAVTREFKGERILWTGRPSAARVFWLSMRLWLFAVPWTAFALGWEAMALQGWFSGKPAPSSMHFWMGIVFPLFGLPFVLVGLGMMGVPVWAWRRARRTVHVLGESRMVSLTIGRSLNVRSCPMHSIVRATRKERRDGSGTLEIVTGSRRDSDGDTVVESETFYGIQDVRKVEQLITEQAERRRRAA